ncbi:hypothetical protein K474DRAFT_1285861 [Panus rudis PR-1116 ss-1]|nr:hypothetical protein K474DRAFT_1285861 [Panus rudis PR-1116 ss-1]
MARYPREDESCYTISVAKVAQCVAEVFLPRAHMPYLATFVPFSAKSLALFSTRPYLLVANLHSSGSLSPVRTDHPSTVLIGRRICLTRRLAPCTRTCHLCHNDKSLPSTLRRCSSVSGVTRLDFLYLHARPAHLRHPARVLMSARLAIIHLSFHLMIPPQTLVRLTNIYVLCIRLTFLYVISIRSIEPSTVLEEAVQMHSML